VVLAHGSAIVGWINLGEVAYITERAAGAAAAVRLVAEVRARARCLLPDEELVVSAAAIKARHRMAYADAFGCALAAREGVPLMTGDPEILVAGGDWSVEDLRSR